MTISSPESEQAFSVSKLVAVTLEKIIDENLQRHLTKVHNNPFLPFPTILNDFLNFPQIGVISQSDPFLKFQSSYEPDVAIDYYIARVAKYSKCSESCLVIMLIYIDRLIENKGLVLTKLNVHRMIITSLMVAAKYHDDLFYNNTYFAKLGGIPIGELNALEVDFLHLQSFSMFVGTALFEKYSTQLQNYKFFMQQVQLFPSPKALSVVVPPLVPLADILNPTHIPAHDLTMARGCDNAFQFSPHRGLETQHQLSQHPAVSFNTHNVFLSQQSMDSSSNNFAFSPASDAATTAPFFRHDMTSASSTTPMPSWFATTSSDSTAAVLTPTSVCHPLLHHPNNHLLNGSAVTMNGSFDFTNTSCCPQMINANSNIFETISRSASHDSVMSTSAPSTTAVSAPFPTTTPVFASHAAWPATAGMHHQANHQQQLQRLFHAHPHHQHHLQTVTPLSSAMVSPQEAVVGPFYHHRHPAPQPSYFASATTVTPSSISSTSMNAKHVDASFAFGSYNHPAPHSQKQIPLQHHQQQLQQQHQPGRFFQQQQQSLTFSHSLLSSRLVTVAPPPAQQLLLSVGF